MNKVELDRNHFESVVKIFQSLAILYSSSLNKPMSTLGTQGRDSTPGQDEMW